MTEIYKGRSIAKGIGEGEVLVTQQPLSIFGGVSPDTGKVMEREHELYGVKLSGKVLVMPPLKGSTAGTWILCRASENGVAPSAIIVTKTDIILTAGAIIGKIPAVDNFDFDPIKKFKTGQKLRVNGDDGTVELLSA
jgi:predicted aconitase with swiveling domain